MALDEEIKAMHALTRHLGGIIAVDSPGAARVIRLFVQRPAGVQADEYREVAKLIGMVENLPPSMRERIESWLNAKCQAFLAEHGADDDPNRFA